ncbi:MAG: hypothetical protein IID33_17030 [Planctomycetes bacterium]|nr:hypothetical protein [Planctomycetota bacterium]
MPYRLLKFALRKDYPEPRMFRAPVKLRDSYDVVIIGAGGHGLAAAYYLANELGITERSVHRITSELEVEGYIEKTRDGRLNWYGVNHELPLRRPERRDVAIGELLKILEPPSQKVK